MYVHTIKFVRAKLMTSSPIVIKCEVIKLWPKDLLESFSPDSN